MRACSGRSCRGCSLRVRTGRAEPEASMTAIFISHSSADQRVAREVAERLAARGFESVFLDVLPEGGLMPGVDWERELYRKLRRCRALIALSSEHSLHSQWCFAEVAQARAMGKVVFPLRLDQSEPNALLKPLQAIDLGSDREGAYQQLYRGLEHAGILEGSWDAKRPPYPGLSCFEEADRAIFFGREQSIEDGLSQLDISRRAGTSRWLTLLGASGSGKSSLLRAGFLPRLRADEQSWIVVGAFRRGKVPAESCALSFVEAFERAGNSRAWRAVHDTLMSEDGAGFAVLAADLRAVSRRPNATLLLVVDQLEELLGNPGSGDTAQEPSGRFLSLLRRASELAGGPLMVLSTLRSDFLGAFQNHPSLRGLQNEALLVKPLDRADIPRVIEGPAELAGIELGPGLTDQIVRDMETEEALPLLAFALRELYERYGGDGLLELSEYRDQLGGLQRAVADRAEAVLSEARARLSPGELAQLRASFLAMVRVNEDGRAVRRRVRWGDVPESVRSTLQRFVEARLLVSQSDEHSDPELEVAHETLFRSWPTFRDWIQETRAFLLWRKRLDPALEQWRRAEHAASELLLGARLAEAQGWLERDGVLLSAEECQFIQTSIRSARLRKRLLAAGIGATLLIVASIAGVAWRMKTVADSEQLRARKEAKWARMSALLAAERSQSDPNASSALLREVPRPGTFRWWQAALDVAHQPKYLAVLRGHTATVRSVAFSADGSKLLTTSEDGSARVWDAERGAALATLGGHGNATVVAAFSPNGDMIATGSFESSGLTILPPGAFADAPSRDNAVRLWSLEPALSSRVLSGHSHWVTGVSFDASGQQVLSTSWDGSARIWDVVHATTSSVLPEPSGAVSSAAFSPDGKTVALGSERGVVRVWSLGSPATPRIIDGPTSSVVQLAFSGDGQKLLVRYRSGTVRALTLADGKLLRGFDNPQLPIEAAAFSPDSAWLATASDRTVTATALGVVGSKSYQARSTVTALAFNPNGERLVLGASDATVHVWDTARTDVAHIQSGFVLAGHVGAVTSVAFNPKRDQVASASVDGTARLWQLSSGEPVPLAIGKSPLLAALSADARALVSMLSGGSLTLTELFGEKRTTLLSSGHENMTKLVISADHARVAGGSGAGQVLLWNATKPGAPLVLGTHLKAISALAFDSGGNRLASADEDGTVHIANADASGETLSFRANSDPVTALAFDPKAERLVSGSADGTVRLWNAKARGEPHILCSAQTPSAGEPHAAIRALTFSKDGTQIAVAADDGTIQVLQASANGAWSRLTLRDHTRPVWSLAFNESGDRLVSASADRTVRVWNSNGAGAPAILRGHAEVVLSAVFDATGERVISASRDGSVRSWTLDARTVLWRQGTPCQSVEERTAILGESQPDAESARRRCLDTLERCRASFEACARAVARAFDAN